MLLEIPWLMVDKIEGLRYVNVLKVDDAEAEVLIGEKDPRIAAKLLSSWGPEEIVLTNGEGLLVYAQGEFSSDAIKGP